MPLLDCAPAWLPTLTMESTKPVQVVISAVLPVPAQLYAPLAQGQGPFRGRLAPAMLIILMRGCLPAKIATTPA